MVENASDLARRLAFQAEAVCRHYLSNGRRQGRYWLVGDTRNTPGRSMFVRLKGPESGKGAAGKWTDVATGEHGDLLDVIRGSCGLVDFQDVADEARGFLNLPHREYDPDCNPRSASAPAGSPKRHGGSSPCPSRLSAPSWKNIYGGAASRLFTKPEVFASIRAAIISRTRPAQPKPGRR